MSAPPAAVETTAQAILERARAGHLLGPGDLQTILGIGPSQFCRRNRRGEFDRFKVHPAIGPRCFSGILIYRWVTGERLLQPTFGRKRA